MRHAPRGLIVKLPGLSTSLTGLQYQYTDYSINLAGGRITQRVPPLTLSSFFFLRKFIGPKNPLIRTGIAFFVLLRRSAKKHGGQVLKPREKNSELIYQYK